VLAHEAALPGLEEALAELKSAAELAPLDAASTGLVATLATRQAEARAQLAHAQLDDLTHRLFEAVADAETALTEGRHDDALAGFQDALLQIAELGDDAAPPYQIAAAMAYQGLAHAVAATAAAEPDHGARAELLAVALEAAEEARRRDPLIKSQFREQLTAELGALEAVGESAPEPDSEAVGESEPEVSAAPVAEATGAAPEHVLSELPDFGTPEPRSDAPLDLSIEAAVKPAPDLETAGDASAESLLTAAGALLAAGEAAQALETYEQSLEATDERDLLARAWCGVAACRRELGRAGEAWEAAETAAGLDSRCVEAYLIQGDLAVADANWRGALQAYQHAEAAAPDDPRVQQGLGTVLSQLEDWDGALESLEKAYAARPEDPDLIFHMGEVFLATGKQEHALACFEEALRLGLPAPAADEVREFLDRHKAAAAAAAPPAATAPPMPAQPAEFDPDTAPPEIKRPRTQENLELRERVIRRAVSDLAFDPEHHKKCRLCQAINDQEAEVCKKCGQSFVAASRSSSGSSGGGGRPCFIATAACGHEAAPEVRILRAFRDGCLERSAAGRALTAVYERCSPPAARWIAARPAWQRRVRRWLVRPLARAAARRLTDRPEED